MKVRFLRLSRNVSHPLVARVRSTGTFGLDPGLKAVVQTSEVNMKKLGYVLAAAIALAVAAPTVASAHWHHHHHWHHHWHHHR
jgi:hypothetical protein